MPSTFTTTKSLEKQATGENDTSWGTKLNANFDLIDQNVGGTFSASMADADYTISTANAENMHLAATGGNTANRNYIVPTLGAFYEFFNNTTGGFTVTVKTSGGTGVVVQQGQRMWVVCDGTNCYDANAGALRIGMLANHAVAGGTADALTAAFTPAHLLLTDGATLFVRAASANATATPTLAVDGLTARTITKRGGAALAVGDIVGNLYDMVLKYNSANTRWELLNPGTLTGSALSGLTAHAALVASSGGAVAYVAPGSSGNLMTSNGTDWASAAPAASVTSIADAMNGGLTFSASTGAVTGAVKPSDLAAKATRALADSVVVDDVAGAANGKKQLITALLSGMAIQTVNTETGAVATGTTVIPFDDTIPQSTEGDQYMTLMITPTNASSTLLITVTAVVTSSVANNMVAALFQDSTANALAVGVTRVVSTEVPLTVTFTHKMAAGTTSSTTFKVRAGGNNAGTTTFNGSITARSYGGVLASSITITEILP